MKKKTYIIGCAAVGILFAACQPKWEMIPPPQAADTDSLDDEDFYGTGSSAFFVTVYGDGDMDGSSWENSLDRTAFFDLLTDNTDVSSANFYLAEGTYVMSDSKGFGLNVKKPVGLIRGGFSKLSEGVSIALNDKNSYPTILSGDVNGNGVADEGDCSIMKLSSGAISFRDIIFEDGYINATYAEADKTWCSGLSASGGTLDLTSCVLRDFVSATGENAGYAGGPAITSTGGKVRMRDCEIYGCTAVSRGGAVRMRDNNAAIVFMDRCSVHGCKQTASWGDAVQLSQGAFCMNNSTLYNNGGTGAQLNGGHAMIVTNSTIVGNASDSYGAVRVEASSGNQEYFINSLMFSLGSDRPSIVKNKDSNDICSKGWCVYGAINYAAGASFDATSDVNISYVPSGSLVDGVFVCAPSSFGQSSYAKASDVFSIVGGTSPSTAPSLGSDFANWVGLEGFSVDQRNHSRDAEKMLPGAYDNSID